MDDGSRLSWFITFFLLICAYILALTETAFSSVNRNKIRMAAERGDRRGERALEVLDNFEQAITTLLICTNAVHLSIAAIVTNYVTAHWGISFVAVSTIITTLVVFFAGEMLPKSIGKQKSEECALRFAGLLVFLIHLLRPAAELLAAIGSFAAKHTSEEPEVSVTEDELYDIIEDMTEEGTLDEEQGELISSALQFGEVTVDSILTPRVDMVSINAADSPEKIMATIKAQNHSRLPIYEGTIDNIIGILQIRAFIQAYLKNGNHFDVRTLAEPAFFVHQSARIELLLPEMSAKKHSLAIVTDNYGGTLGLVTVEDILEELVGEIWDEDDVAREEIIPQGERCWLVDAAETVTDVFDTVDFEDPEDDEDLINTRMGEWTYTHFPSIPAAGSSFEYFGLKVTVASIERNRILKLRVETPEPATEGGEEA